MSLLNQGLLIAIEGIDGSGKSTLARSLHTSLQQFKCILTKEPGGTPFGMMLRTILQDKNVKRCPQSEFLLFAADRAQHMEQVIKPHLTNNYIVISDRLADSSLVYQGYGRGLNRDTINYINSWAMQGIKPDLTLYVHVDIDCAMQRIMSRQETITSFEQEKKEFFTRVIQGFNTIYANRADVITIDGTQPAEECVSQAYDACIELINHYKYKEQHDAYESSI